LGAELEPGTLLGWGDFTSGSHTAGDEMIDLRLGDCLEVMKTIPDKSVDLILTDPPYGLDKKLSSGGGKHKNSKFRLLYEGQGWDKVISQEYFSEMFRVSKNQIIFGANYYSLPPTRGIICWDKKQMLPTFSRWEYAWTSFDLPALMYEIRNGEDSRSHPTQKPEKLMRLIIQRFSIVPEVILDPFMGSGTTGVACKELGRSFIGIEIHKPYFDIAKRRIEQATQDMFVGITKE
jgi:site-specific DNA-methyltransferase (adenine-specific)